MLTANNTPSKPILAIRAGTVRRQARLEVNQPFKIPHPGSDQRAVEISLFQELASELLPDDVKQEVHQSIPFWKPDGTTSQVKLCIRRGAALAASKAPKSSAAQDSLGNKTDYLDHHQLQQRIQSLMQDVLREQPGDPYRYMLEQLKTYRAEPAADANASQSSVVPHPPASPKSNGSPRKGKHVKSASGGEDDVQSLACELSNKMCTEVTALKS